MNNIFSSRLSIACIGDLMLGDRAAKILHSIETDAMADLVWWPMTDADLIFANLEAPITESTFIREDKRYNFKTSSEILELFDHRFVLSLANNHILDYGENGLLNTIESLNEYGIRYAGAGRNLAEANDPLMVNVKGVNIGIVCAADNRYQSATESSPGTFPACPQLLKQSLQKIAKQIDLAIVSIHAGMEDIPVPSPNQLALAKLCLEEGADIVCFHHAHRISGFLEDEGKLVLFGTGNYIFPPTHYIFPPNHRKDFSLWRESAVWKIVFQLPDLQMTQVDIEPVFLDENGLPIKPTKTRYKRILKRIHRFSERIHRKKYLNIWRYWEICKPTYLWLTFSNYADIFRRQGALFLLKTIYSGIKTHLK
jgi:poly-gamma-glutamate synthesis protein (capsule biosynthesis protein)